ncbi:hypothetical protein [Bacillus manliponensis]|uniref:hypothetical protein n=1 Tax=Bacillus manliponensis TaxID=574376 RepID=UPI00068A9CAA|nr:hypothetical protein [Bacillus manliponensis]
MKKLIASVFVAVLAFVSFGAPQAMAAGDHRADIIQKGSEIYNTILVQKSLHDSPGNTNIVNYVSPVQDVKIIRASFLINTWKGHKWVQYHTTTTIEGWNRIRTLDTHFNASNATLKVESTNNSPTYIYDSSIGGSPISNLSSQTVEVRQAWYQIETWLGPKWIGYQLR